MDELKLLRDHYDAQSAPSEQIVAAARSRLIADTVPETTWLRRRGRIVVMATAAAVLAAVGVSAPELFDGGSVAPAYAVTRVADGKLMVTLRDVHDPSGLHRTLAAAGVPNRITMAPSHGTYCQMDGKSLDPPGFTTMVNTHTHGEYQEFVIDPTKLPPGGLFVLQLMNVPIVGHPDQTATNMSWSVFVGPVKCTPTNLRPPPVTVPSPGFTGRPSIHMQPVRPNRRP